MSDVEEISYSREATICAFRDYYRLLVELYMDESDIIEPPKGGWPSISPEFQQLCGKSDEVIALLRNLPYIREDCLGGEFHPPQGTPICYWADWQSLAASTVRQATAGQTEGNVDLKLGSEGEAWENVPSHVIGLTFGDRENKVFLLDTQLGIVYWPECDGGGDHRNNLDNDPSFIDPVYDMDKERPENEVEWRNEPAWAIADFFELLKMQYLKLNWIPTNARQVIATDFDFDESQDGVAPMLQGIFREHGWSLEQGGAHYRKRECLEAVETALKERYPSFGGWV